MDTFFIQLTLKANHLNEFHLYVIINACVMNMKQHLHKMMLLLGLISIFVGKYSIHLSLISYVPAYVNTVRLLRLWVDINLIICYVRLL